MPSYPCDQRKYAETDGQVKKLHDLLVAVWVVRESIERDHAEACFAVGMHLRDRFHELQDDIDAPIIRGALFSIKQSDAGKGNLGNIHFFRSMVIKICKKIDSTEYADVFKYWQTFVSQDDAEGEHGEVNLPPYVWAEPQGSEDADCPLDGDFRYWFIGEDDWPEVATTQRIRTTINRIQKREPTPE